MHIIGLQLDQYVGQGMALERVVVTNENGCDNTLRKNRYEQDTILFPAAPSGSGSTCLGRSMGRRSGRALHVWMDDPSLIAGYQVTTSLVERQSRTGSMIYRSFYGSKPQPQADALLFRRRRA